MVAKVIRYRVKDDLSYFTDQGTALKYNSVFRAPSDIAEDPGVINEILEAFDSVQREENGICGESSGTTPRRIIFKRSNGNSFGLVLPVRSKAIDAAQKVWSILKATRYPAVCIELEGEYSANLIEELAEGRKGELTSVPLIEPSAEDGKNAFIYSSVMKAYKADSPFGQTILMPFKSQSNSSEDPYSELSSYFETCVEPVTKVSCIGSTSIDYRRYIPAFLTSLAGNETTEKLQTVTAPCSTNETSQIFACGQFLATISSVACLAYYGESNKKLHKLLTP
jgi:hypothetical protein